MEIFILLLTIAIVTFSTWFQYRQAKRLMELTGVNSKAPNAPNKITRAKEEEIEFTEDNPLDLPKDVKFEIEGGDAILPQNYDYKD